MARKRLSGGGGGGGGGHDAGGGLRWLLTYADMITLLLALFIYFFSVSVIKEDKVVEFSQAMAQSFGIFEGSPNMMEGGKGVLTGQPAIPSPHSAADTEIDIQLNRLREAGFQINRRADEVRISIADEILFSSGATELLPSAKPVLDNLAQFMNIVAPGYPVRIEGHTDNREFSGRDAISSNLELSAIRACSMAAALRRDYDVDPARMEAVGLGPYHPFVGTLYAQTDDERARNRRIEVVIILKKND